MSAEQALKSARRFAKQGEPERAISICTDFLARYPSNKRVRQTLTGLMQQRSAAQNPPPAQQAELRQMVATGDPGAVRSKVVALLTLFPQSGFLWMILGHSLLKQGDLPGSQQAFGQAIAINDMDPDALSGLADLHRAAGQADQAIPLYIRSLSVEPGNPWVLNNLSNALITQGRFAEAVTQMERALKLEPKSAVLCFNLANAVRMSGDLPRAERLLCKAAGLDRSMAQVPFNLGLIQRLQGDLPKAIDSFARTLKIDPSHAAARMEMVHQMAHMCDWGWVRVFDAAPDDGLGSVPAGPFPYLAAMDDPVRLRRVTEAYAAQVVGPAAETRFDVPADRPERLRIGYFSADFHSHATMHLLGGLFKHHDPARFDIYVYSFGPDIADADRARVTDNVAKFQSVGALSDAQIADLARADGLDIAVDLKGYTGDSRPGIFRAKVAPIQIAWLGYPGTMGTRVMDYVIADATVLPPQLRDSFTEAPILMPDSYQINDNQRAISDRPMSRAEFGLPEDSVVFCCFNNSYKITDQEFDIWMRLLTQVPGSVLWLLRGTPWTEPNLREQARARGVDPDRLVFADRLPVADHLARHRLADLFLDTFNCNAHTTASDALWAGLPVVTKAGQQFAARVAASLLTAHDLPELITETAADYEALALDLSRTPARLAALKQRMAATRLTCALFQTERFVTQLETGFDRAHAQFRAGSPPEMIDLAKD